MAGEANVGETAQSSEVNVTESDLQMNLSKQNKMARLQMEDDEESDNFVYNSEISLDESIDKSNELTLELRKKKNQQVKSFILMLLK